MTMDRVQLRDELLVDMTKSVFQHETRQFRIDGCLEGIELCKGLVTLEDYEKVIAQRTAQLTRMREERTKTGKYSTDDCWKFRCGTAQIERVYEVLKGAEYLADRSHGETLSVRAILQAGDIIHRHLE